MLDQMQPMIDTAIPGQSLTAELGSRPWTNPPQYNTVEEALDYYIPRLQSDEVTEQLLDVLEMGIPVTTKVKYTSGLEKDKEMSGTTVKLALERFKQEQKDDSMPEETADTPVIAEMREAADKRTGLMSRS